MSISIKKYVDITSGVGAGTAVKERELILRLFTKNPLVQAGTVSEMTELSDVISKFGDTAEESLRATPYFGFISKLITKAKKISFAAYADQTTESAPSIVGGTALQTIADWKAITDGAVRIQVGKSDYLLKGMTFASVSDLAGVATKIQTELRKSLGNATVTYDSVNQHFMASFIGHDKPANVSVIAPGAGNGTDISTQLGWTTAAGATFAPGSKATSFVDYVNEADLISDNYGSLAFIGGETFTLDDWTALAAWNNSQNVKYMLLVPVTTANWKTWYDALQSYSGVALTIVDDPNTEHDEDIPGIILAATDYNVRNAGQNYMFQQVPGFTPKVIDNAEALDMDEKSRVNYYGRTMNAGQQLSFYQNGYLCGTNTAPLQMNVYANEQWLKAACTAAFLKFELDQPIIPATDEGRAMTLAVLQEQVDRALFNGTIKTGKDLTTAQKLYINTVTGDTLAWQQIQSIGYWMDTVVQQQSQANGVIKYIIDYTLVYSKADAVNKITGRHILV